MERLQNQQKYHIIDYSSQLQSTEETFLQYIKKTDDHNNQCKLCYEEFKEIVDESHIIKYTHFILNNVDFYLTTTIKADREYPDLLVKCKNCSFVCCVNCSNLLSENITDCPQRCGKSIQKQTRNTKFKYYSTEFNEIDQFYLIGNLISMLEHLQAIQHQIKVIPLSMNVINITKQQTIQAMDQVVFDIQTQEIRGIIQDFYSDSFIQLRYPVNIICSQQFILDKQGFNKDQLILDLIKIFKEDIINIYDFIQQPSGYMQTIPPLMQLGFVDFIQKHMFDYTCQSKKTYPNRYNDIIGRNSLDSLVQIQHLNVYDKYAKIGTQLHYCIVLMDHNLKNRSQLTRVLTKEEFIDFFAI